MSRQRGGNHFSLINGLHVLCPYNNLYQNKEMRKDDDI